MSFTDGLWSLPQSWSWLPAAEIGDVSLGRQRSPENHSGPSMRPYVRSANITWAGWDLSDVKEMNFNVADFATFQLRAGDVLLNEGSGSADEVGKPAVWEKQIANCCFQNTLLRFRSAQVDSWYARAFFSFSARAGHLVQHTQGVNIFHIGKKGLEQLALPVAPLPEQRRIVAKIDRLSTRSKRARIELERIEKLQSKYRHELLEVCFGEGGQNSQWKAVRVSDFADVGTGATPKRGESRYYARGNIPWVTSGCVNQGNVSEADEFITDTALSETNCKLFPIGTLLVALYGEGKTRGKVATLQIEAATNQALAAITINRTDIADRDFIFLFFRWNYHKLREQAAGGVQPNLNLGIIKSIEIRLPPLTEQREIVRRIEHAFAAIDRLAAEAASAQQLLDRLDQAVLAKAFRGELVPQDPNDEPASVLLERIRADRAAAPARKRGRRPKTAS